MSCCFSSCSLCGTGNRTIRMYCGVCVCVCVCVCMSFKQVNNLTLSIADIRKHPVIEVLQQLYSRYRRHEYVYVCVCVCVRARACLCVCACVHACACVYSRHHASLLVVTNQASFSQTYKAARCLLLMKISSIENRAYYCAAVTFQELKHLVLSC
jgi:hypothetical protein